MRYIFSILLGCFTVVCSKSQTTNAKINHYSNLLGKRNAALIGCDSVAPYLEEAYKKILTAILYYRNNPQTYSNRRRIILYKLSKKEIYTILSKKERRRYKKLYKIKGNILLL